jgi:hypothetical protein
VIQQVEAERVRQSVDIIMVVDNSGSMDDEVAAIRDNINVNFASILEESGLDYRVILVSRHSDSEGDDTSLCIESPLSGLSQCFADAPVFSERFFQYSTEIGSDNSFEVLLETYAASDNREEEFGNAPLGWSAWLRPESKKVFLSLSDDNEDMSALEFLFALTEMAPEQFGTDPGNPGFVWHSIVGLVEKAVPTEPYYPTEPIDSDECTGNGGNVVNAGEAYQELSRITGGLRFPLCQFDAYDTVFRTIADDVLITGQLACAFAIPAPPQGQSLDLDKVAVAYAPGDGGADQLFGQVAELTACQANAFLVEGDRISLCPQACDAVRADPSSAVDVLFTCENTLILR